MKKIIKLVLIFCFTALLATVLFYWIDAAPAGTTKVLAKMTDAELGKFWVFAEQSDFLKGWRVTLFQNNNDGKWYAYYLEHEDFLWFWRKTELKIVKNQVIVFRNSKVVARCDLEAGYFYDKRRGSRYTMAEWEVINPSPWKLHLLK